MSFGPNLKKKIVCRTALISELWVMGHSSHIAFLIWVFGVYWKLWVLIIHFSCFFTFSSNPEPVFDRFHLRVPLSLETFLIFLFVESESQCLPKRWWCFLENPNPVPVCLKARSQDTELITLPSVWNLLIPIFAILLLYSDHATRWCPNSSEFLCLTSTSDSFLSSLPLKYSQI